MTNFLDKNLLNNNLIGLSLVYFLISLLSLYVFKSELVAYAFIALFLIAFGIPHGALDIFRILSKKNRIFTLFVYIAAVFFSFTFFKILPNLFFVFFFVLALVHFVDVELKNLKAKQPAFMDLAFTSIFLMPRLYESELQNIFIFLNAEKFFEMYLGALPICLFLGALFFALSIYKNYINNTLISYIIAFNIYLFLAFFTNILITFFYFFNIIHAKRHMDLSFGSLPNFNLKIFIFFCFSFIIASVVLVYSFSDTESFYSLLLMSLVLLLSLTPAHFLLEISNNYESS